jgi:phage-related protein
MANTDFTNAQALNLSKITHRFREAELVWIGSSLEVLREWPEGIRVSFGQSLRMLQNGLPAALNIRPMQSIGRGVFELKDADETAWYR